MRLRFYTEYDKYGFDCPKDELQYWDEELKEWHTVPSVRVSYREREEAMTEEDYS